MWVDAEISSSKEPRALWDEQPCQHHLRIANDNTPKQHRGDDPQRYSSNHPQRYAAPISPSKFSWPQSPHIRRTLYVYQHFVPYALGSIDDEISASTHIATHYI
jgi:hypothetical protein